MIQPVVLKANNLTVVKGKREILMVPDLAVQKGEFLAITGPNGAGKSTLLKALAFLEPAGGDVSFNDARIDWKRSLEARRRMAMVFQDPLLLSGTTMDNVTAGLRIRGVNKKVRQQKAHYWLDKLNVAHLAKRDVRTLSGGEAQRVSLARALALDPDVLFLDEPFTYLDIPTKAALVSELKAILVETGTTTLMVTHDLTDVPFLADRLMVVIQGSIRQLGPVHDVLDYPVSRQVAEFLGVENIWQGNFLQRTHLDRGYHDENDPKVTLELTQGVHLQVGLTSIARYSSEDLTGPLLACIRPEHVIVDISKPDSTGEENVFCGRIKALYPYGYYYRVTVEIANFQVTAMAAAVQFSVLPQVGDEISVTIPANKIHLIKRVIS